MSDVLIARELVKTYYQGSQAVRVLSGVSFSVRAGERVAIIGRSGSGKSTLLHLLAGLDEPDSGAVIVAGDDLTAADPAQRARIRNAHMGFVYQFHHLLPEFTALENVAMPLRLGGMDNRKAERHAGELLARVGLAQRTDHRPAALSGGERQRVAVARALVAEPEVVLADEPTGNLDPATTERVFATLIKMVREEGAGVLVATHNLALTRHMDRILTLQDGKLVDYTP